MNLGFRMEDWPVNVDYEYSQWSFLDAATKLGYPNDLYHYHVGVMVNHSDQTVKVCWTNCVLYCCREEIAAFSFSEERLIEVMDELRVQNGENNHPGDKLLQL